LVIGLWALVILIFAVLRLDIPEPRQPYSRRWQPCCANRVTTVPDIVALARAAAIRQIVSTKRQPTGHLIAGSIEPPIGHADVALDIAAQIKPESRPDRHPDRHRQRQPIGH
jgi:hypothetical protein